MRLPILFIVSLLICCWLVHSTTALLLHGIHGARLGAGRGGPSSLLLFGTNINKQEAMRRASGCAFNDVIGRLLDTTSSINTQETTAATTSTNEIRSSSDFSQQQTSNKRVDLASIGFWGHSGLALLSFVLVKAVYAAIRASRESNDGDDQQQQQQPAGILNRCPWPFIFFHDIKQGFKDSPTWMVVTWVALWRIIKAVRPTVAP